MNRRQVLSQQRQSLVAKLNTLMGAAPERPLPPVARPAAPAGVAAALDLDALYTLALASRHELKATDALITRGERAADLAKKNYWPDIVVGAGFVNVGRRGDAAGVAAPPPDNGKNAWTVSVGVSVPLQRDRLKAAVEQAEAETAAEQAARVSVANDVRFAVRDQVVRLQSLDEQVSLFRDVLIPQAREAQRSTESAYETGQVGVLDLLDTERVLFEVRLANARQQADLLVALARLERAVGTRFPR
jgi:outer membrane protein TolC